MDAMTVAIYFFLYSLHAKKKALVCIAAVE